jgi:hypothetical protein
VLPSARRDTLVELTGLVRLRERGASAFRLRVPSLRVHAGEFVAIVADFRVAATTTPANFAAPAPVDAASPTMPAIAAPASATILTGRWKASCDSNDEVYPVTMRQDGSRLRVVVEGQAEYQGTFDGHRLKGTSADGLDSFDGTAVSATELRLDWEGRTSADSRHVYHNIGTMPCKRGGSNPFEGEICIEVDKMVRVAPR